METPFASDRLSNKSPKSTGPMDQLPSRILFLMVCILILGACKSSTPTPAPTPTPTPVPPTPLWESSIKPTPTIADSGLAVVDDGSALPLRVVEQSPAGGQELSLGGEVVLKFNQAMNPTKTAAAWKMTDPEDGIVAGKISWPDPFTLQFKPDEPLAVGTAYKAVLEASAVSAEGVPFSEPLELQFNTVGELQVSQSFPADGTLEVASDAVITAIFNRPVVPLVIAEERDQLPNPLEFSPSVSGEGEWVNTSVFAFRPDQPLRGGSTYWVTIRAGLSDALGETQLGQDYTWMFTTISPSIKSFELGSGRRNPADEMENILLDESFIVRFAQPMDETQAEAAFSLTPDGGSPVALTSEWNEDDTRVTIAPVQLLDLETEYTLIVDASAQTTDGNSLAEGLTWSFTTIPPPSVVYISPPQGDRGDGFHSELYIKFASPMMIDSVKEKIVITPEPEEEIQWWYNPSSWSMRAYILKPSTTYEVRALPGMSDIYGNLTTREYVVRFTTNPASAQAGLQMPYRASVMQEGGPQQFYITYRNVEYVEVKLYSITAYEFTYFLNGRMQRDDYNPAPENLVWGTVEYNAGELNERVLEALQPTTSNGDPLPPGFYFITLDTPDIPHRWQPFLSTRLMVVANANLTFKSATNEALVWVTELESGEPISNVPLKIYNDDFQEIGRGFSDSSGLLEMEVPTPDNPYDDFFVITGEGSFFGFTTSMWGSGVNQYDYGIWSSYYAPGNQPKAYIYTDRPIYRPDQPVYFKGVLRLDDDLDYSIPAYETVHVKIENFKETIYEEDLPLNAYGSFEGEITLDPEAVLGYYTILAQLPGEEDILGSVSFTVAEYHKPEFQIQVDAEPTDVLDGEEYTVTVSADYYSGGNVAEALVEWTLLSRPYSFDPADEYSGYSFSDYDRDRGYYEDFNSYYSEIIAEGEGYTDAAGQLVLTLPADLSEFKTSRQFIFEATVTDLSQNTVSGRTRITVHNCAFYPGVRSMAYVGKAGDAQSFELVVLDWNSNPIPDQIIQVDVVERRWHSVQEQDASGVLKWSSSVEEIPVFSDEVTSDDNGEASISFTPQEGGVYKAKVTVLDPQGNQGYSSAYIWVAGESYIPWRQTNDRGFDLVTDRTSYNPGDTAEILIASPFQGDSYALITIERGHIYMHEVLHLTSNSTVYELPITSNLAPNVYVSVVVVKGIDETNPRPNFKMGVTELKVDTREQEIFVTVTPDKVQASPGEEVTYTVKTFDNNGNPVDAELSLGLSDLATLSLMSPNSLPVLDFFYSERTLAVWTSIPIVMSLEEYNATISEYEAEGPGMGSGGGKGAGDLGVMEVREDFPDTAFWDAQIQTGSDGEAMVTVTLPDNLTTWRMDARAVTLDTKVGQTEHDLISTRPLLVRPQTPRFFVVGDQVRLGAAVHNNTEQALSVEVELFVQGVSLESDATHTLELKANRQAYVTWDVRVEEDASRVDLVFNAEGVAANGEEFQDASRPPLGTLESHGIPVYRYEARETVGTSGLMTSGGTLLEAISLPSTMTASEGTLSIQVAPSLAAGMTDGLTYLENYPYGCVEQTISRFLPNVISTRALKSAGLSDPTLEANLRAEVNTALQRLVNWQNPDGGWGWWPSVNQNSDVQTSAYVVLGLIEAQEAGYTINQEVLDLGVSYLQRQVKYVRSLESSWLLNRQAFVLYVMARAENPMISAAVQLFDQRQNMAIYARAFLARTFDLIDEADPRIQTLLSDFASLGITSATGTHWEEETRDRYNWNTDTRTTAIVLSALSEIDPTNPLNANAVRWLMSHRTNGHWRGTQETAWTLMALTNWMEASGELGANYQYAVALNGERLGGGAVNESTLRRTHRMQVDILDMLKDEANRLAIARDDGPGNLYYTTHMELSLPVDQVSALDQGIILSRSYYLYDSSETDLSEAEPTTAAEIGDLLLVRLTLVAPNSLHYVMVEDPLPAGLEAVDPSLEIGPENLEVPRSYGWKDIFRRGWGWWRFEHTQFRDEKVVLSASYLPAGTYIYTYLVRASTAGTFSVIPPTAQEFYFPEVYGRGEGETFIVRP